MKDIDYLKRLVDESAIKCLKSLTVTPRKHGGFSIAVTYFRSEQTDDVDVIECVSTSIDECKNIAEALVSEHLARYPHSAKVSKYWKDDIASLGKDRSSLSIYHPGVPWLPPGSPH